MTTFCIESTFFESTEYDVLKIFGYFDIIDFIIPVVTNFFFSPVLVNKYLLQDSRNILPSSAFSQRKWCNVSQYSGITLLVFLLTTKQIHESGRSTKLSATEVLRVKFRYQKNPFRRECQLKKKKKKKRQPKEKRK